MFILGLIAFFQTTFIPGFLLMKYVGGKDRGKIHRLVYSFGLSLLINYLLVFTFTAAGIYKPLELYIILLVEGILAVYYWKYRAGGPVRFTLDFSRYTEAFKRFIASRSLVYNLLLFISFAVILWYVFIFFYFLGGVFEHWDPVTGWNRFAVDWAANQFPTDTWRYPQLVPANWSISYALMQTTGVQAFAKAIMPLFSIAILLLFLQSALKTKKPVWLAALIFYGVFLQYLFEPSFIASGYVDIAASFFAFLAFHALYNRLNRQAVVFACAAAVTKQSGLYIMAVIFIWLSIRVYKNRNNVPAKKSIAAVLLMLLAAALIVLPWYMMKQVQIQHGTDQSEIKLTQDAHRNPDLLQRLNRGVQNIAARHHPKLRFLVYAYFLITLLGLFHRNAWAAALFIAVPYALVWGLFFSYDARNLTPALPFMAFSAAYGTVVLKKCFTVSRKLPALRIPVPPLVVIALLGAAVMNWTVYDKVSLLRSQNLKKMKIGDAGLNDLLYRYHEKKGLSGKIATDYQYLKFLPGLSQFYFKKGGRLDADFMDFLDSPNGKDVHFLLVPKILKREKETYRRFQQKLKSGQYRLLFKWRGYLFVSINASGGQGPF
jgi:hypothetical protein